MIVSLLFISFLYLDLLQELDQYFVETDWEIMRMQRYMGQGNFRLC